MMHLTEADYREMPWANGRGNTVEMLRVDKPDGRLLWRLSRAQCGRGRAVLDLSRGWSGT